MHGFDRATEDECDVGISELRPLHQSLHFDFRLIRFSLIPYRIESSGEKLFRHSRVLGLYDMYCAGLLRVVFFFLERVGRYGMYSMHAWTR